MSILVLIEHDNENVKTSSLNTITAAKKIDKKVHAIISFVYPPISFIVIL